MLEGFRNLDRLKNSYSKAHVVMLSGFAASGKSLHEGAIRARNLFGEGNFTYFASLSTREALAEGKGRERYKEMAKSVMDKMVGKDKLLVIAHSLGGAEALSLLKEISTNVDFKDKQIDLMVFSPLGYGTERLKSLTELINGSIRINSARGVFESATACPLPEEISKEMSPFLQDIEGINKIPATLEDRERRRKIFEDAVKNTPGVNFNEVIDKINIIDKDLNKRFKETGKVDKRLLKQRAALISPFINPMINDAIHLDSKTQESLSQSFPKIKKQKLSRELQSWSSYVINMLPTVINLLKMGWKGYSKELITIIFKANNNGIKINVNLVYMENDRLIKPRQIKSTKEESATIANFWFLKEVTHFVPSYDAYQMLIAIDEIVREKVIF